MLRAFAVSILAALPAAALASPPPAPPAGPPPAADAAPAGEIAVGLLRGRVLSAGTGRPLPGASVSVAGAMASSDAEGRFELELPAGRHELLVVHPTAGERRLEVDITAGAVNALEVGLSRRIGLILPSMEEVNVVAAYVPGEGSVEAVIDDVREAFGVAEVIGIDQMVRIGDSTAADALKRVTGLTLQQDRYIVVRGQPARYTQTTLNGFLLPSPDPVRRIVPLDLFPTGTLSKVQVFKSYDPALPGTFGGGLVALRTAEVPDGDRFTVSLEFGGNDLSTGKRRNDHEAGGRDWLAADDGERALPAAVATAEDAAALTAAAADLPNTWATREKSLPLDSGLGLGTGHRFALGEAELGLRLDFDWAQSARSRDIVERDYALTGDGRLALRNDQVEHRTDINVDLSGLLGFDLDWAGQRIGGTGLLLRNAVRRTALTEGVRVVSDDLVIRDTLHEYNARELRAWQWWGEHLFENLTIDWRFMTADATRDAPDRRQNLYRQQSSGQWVFHAQSRGTRRWDRSADDIDQAAVDLAYRWPTDGRVQTTLHAGVDAMRQTRRSRTRRLSFRPLVGADLAAPPEVLLDPAALGDTLAVSDQTQTNDAYDGEQNQDGVYLKAELDLWDDWRLVAGARREAVDMQVSTFAAGGSAGPVGLVAGFEREEWLPALDLVWRFAPDMQLRLSGGRSLSLPMLNELSPARYFDPETNEEYLGNPTLQPATIDGTDLRWEWYPSERETLSLGVFRKRYRDPIEESFVAVGGSAFLRQVKNARSAQVDGVELGLRVDAPRLWPGEAPDWLNFIYLSANAAFVDSSVRLDPATLGLETFSERPLQGQADEVYNLQLGYDGEVHDFDVAFNRVGRRLQVVGIEGQPDVYEAPTLYIDAAWNWWLAEGFRLRVKAANLGDETVRWTQGGEVYREYRRGLSYSLGLSWTFE